MARRTYQVAAAAIGWIAFGLLWWLAFRHLPSTHQMLTGGALIAGFAAFMAVVTGAWITWNVRVWKRDGPKPLRLPTPHDYSRDVTGRELRADFDALKSARFIVVDLVEGPDGLVKTYSAGDEAVTSEEAAVCAL